MAWFFRDAPNTAVFTSKDVAENNEWIQSVSHDKEDGAWQFHSSAGAPRSESDSRIVSLRTIVRLDSSIETLAELPLGWVAWRDSPTGIWNQKPKESSN